MGTDNEQKGKQGKFSCFVAYDLSAASSRDLAAQSRDKPGAHVPRFFKFLLAESLQVRSPLFSASRAHAVVLSFDHTDGKVLHALLASPPVGRLSWMV